MAVKPIGTTALTWGSLLGRGNREPIDATQLNYSYTDLLWELNQRTVSYQIGANNGGSGNYYVGLITAVPYVNEDDKRKDSHYTVDANGNKKLETIDMKGPWYVSYKGTDKGRGTAQNKYGFVPDGNPNTYYADRIVLKQEMDYTLDNGFVRKTQLGTYYTGVGHWYDSYTKSKTYANGLECPDGVYFPTTSYAEIFNDYTHNVATGIFSHAEGGSTTASGNYSHAEGGGTQSIGDSSHAEGWYTQSIGGSSHAEGNFSYAGGNYSHAEGGSTKAIGDSSHAEGVSTQSIGQSSHAEGTLSYAGGIGSHAEGWSTKANGDQSHAEGLGTKANGQSSHAEGGSTKANGDNSHAEGHSTTASGNQSHAEGGDTTASGDYSHAEGYGTTASGDYSHAEGTGSYTKGVNAHAENSSYANGNNSHSSGEATAGGVNSFAHGVKGTLASGVNSIALVSGTASGSNSIAIKGTASGSNSIAFTGTASGENSISLDGTASGSNSVSIQGTAKSTDSVAIGQGAIAETNQGAMALIKGHATGQQSLATNASSASGTNSVAMNASSATNTQSFAVNNSTASGINSTSTNKGTASGENSISTNISTATGGNSAALNNGNASGEGSVAMNYSKATGKGSVAIGLGTIASGEYSLSQGHETRANNHDSHAEGYGTNASGDQSHTEGIVTTTNGLASHAEGQGSTTGTNATAAHAEGSYTIANNESEHAQGKYNVSDTENSGTLFTIGNGTANNKRHNVVGIYHNGDINIEGPNTTNHNTGYFKTTVDGSHTEVVRGNYTQTIGTASKNNTCNITVNGNTTNRFNGTSDTRTTGATYEGYGSTFISTTKGAKYIYSYSTTYIHSNGNVTNTTAGTRTNITDGYVSETNKASIGTYTTGTSYQYTSGNKTDAVGGTRTNITVGNVNVTTRGAHTESITNERSFTVGKHDSLIVSSGGRTEKITGEKITQVVSGNINAYTDDTHDTRLHTRSTYIEAVHTYIGDKTNTYISGNYSVGLGQGIKISSYTNVSAGKYNKDEASYFAVGIGTSDTNRKNAFWISQGTTAGTNGVAYFSNNTYVYGNTYDPSQYPNNKEDKSWSAVVTYNMYRNSYTYLYKTVNDKFNTFGTGTYFTKSIDPFTYTPVSYTLHYTTQTFNNKENSWPIVKHQYVLPQAIPGALENDNSGMAGLMSARDKARLDSIWEGDKQIAGIQISTGSWQVFKNDGSTYTLANIKHQSNSITNIKVEYGFKVKWSGTWKWTVNNQKNAEECKGAWGTTLPAVNTNSSTYTSPVLSGNESGNWSQICYETIYAAKRGLIISGYPDDYAASSNGSRHLGSIVPASGKDNRSCSVSWATYRLLFYGMCTQAEADGLNIGVMKTKTTKDITKRSWEIYYNSDSSHCFFMAYPAAFGNIATIKKNGVEIITSSFLKVGAVNYTNGAGYTQQYYVYRSGVGSAGMSITIS